MVQVAFVRYGSNGEVFFTRRRSTHVEKREMGRIAVSFQALQVVTFDKELAYGHLTSRNREPFVIWKNGRLFLRTHVGKNHPRCFAAWIGLMTDLTNEIAPACFRGGL